MRPFLAAALLALAATAPSAAGAQGKKAGPASTATPLPRDTVKKLKSGDASQVKSALDDVRMSAKDGAPAVPAVADLLKQGMPMALTIAAIETLCDTENEGASEVLGWYAHHRDPAVRKAAVAALARTRGAAATKSLRAALSDPDPAVRGFAATGLGSLKAKDAVS